jgi:hypothetical protein
VVDKIVNLIFKWKTLRLAIFDEVNLYNSLTRIMNDPESMQTASAFWDDGDGWRGWTIKDDKTYYFHDLPEKSLSDVMYIIMEKDGYDS